LILHSFSLAASAEEACTDSPCVTFLKFDRNRIAQDTPTDQARSWVSRNGGTLMVVPATTLSGSAIYRSGVATCLCWIADQANPLGARLGNPRLALTVEQLAHIENRPALSRWHPDYAEAFTAYVKGR
jgi:hypothetical protein